MSPFHRHCYSGDKEKLACGVLIDLRSQLKYRKNTFAVYQLGPQCCPSSALGQEQREDKKRKEQIQEGKLEGICLWGNGTLNTELHQFLISLTSYGPISASFVLWFLVKKKGST